MYLLVFSVLVISMIGVYTQVLAVQTARVFSHQNAVASAMLQWHAAAVSMAASVIDTNFAAYQPLMTSGCSLTYGSPVFTTNCPPPICQGVSLQATGTVTDSSSALNRVCDHTTALPEPVHLSASYDYVNHPFYSVAYRDASSGTDYVVTLAAAGATPPGYLTMANGRQMSLTSGDLMQQLRNIGSSVYTFGGINAAGQLVVTGFQYSLPAGFTSYSGAVAVIASPAGF